MATVTKKITQLQPITDAELTSEAILPVVVSDPLSPNRQAKTSQVLRCASAGSKAAPGIAFSLNRSTGLYQSAANTTANTDVGTSGYLLTSAGTGKPTWTNPASLSFSTANSQFYSIGVGTAASQSIGEIRATGDVTSGYSDDKLKNRLGNIENALDKVSQLAGFYYRPNDLAKTLGYNDNVQVGVSAQQVQQVLPEVVVPAPVDSNFLTVQYERMIPLLIEAIKELKSEVDEIKKKI